MNDTLYRSWPTALTAIVAILYAWIGLAAHGWDRILGLAGALFVLAALVVAQRSIAVALVLLVAGALPLAIGTWWSIVTPLLAILALLLGQLAIRNAVAGYRERT
ncbi:hypothetical protein OHA70_36275 [Kribbella sp. NBC_00382]|uniref:hypothetical protein n=1 Tax=Kribbella sp. NBC_00382 TaxID=2975967 RepID=UPI002E1B311A